MTLPPLRDPERTLSLSYAPSALREALKVLWLLDERLETIASGATRPIAAIKLAWWREALERLDTAPPPAEPLLAGLAAHLLPRGVSGAMLAEVAAGWDALIDDADETAAERLLRHARLRGGILFTVAANLLGGATRDVTADGALWAAATAPGDFIDDAGRAAALSLPRERTRWPLRLRSLGLLVRLAEARLRDPAAPVASPRRAARTLWYGLTGY